MRALAEVTETTTDMDVYDGDNVANDSDADICVIESGETPTHCEP